MFKENEVGTFSLINEKEVETVFFNAEEFLDKQEVL